MLVIVGILFLVAWLMAKFMWHVASFGVHVLLLGAIVAMIFHFIRARGPGAAS